MLIIVHFYFFYFQQIKTFSWLHVNFLTRNGELSTLPCLHLNTQNQTLITFAMVHVNVTTPSSILYGIHQ